MPEKPRGKDKHCRSTIDWHRAEYSALMRLKHDLEEELALDLNLYEVFIAAVALACIFRGVPMPENTLDRLLAPLADLIEEEGGLSTEK